MKNARVTAFTVSELLRKNQEGDKIIPTPRLRLTKIPQVLLFSKSHF